MTNIPAFGFEYAEGKFLCTFEVADLSPWWTPMW